MDGWIDRSMDGSMDGWMDGWVEYCLSQVLIFYMFIPVCYSMSFVRFASVICVRPGKFCRYSYWTENKGGMNNSTGKREDLIGGWRKQHNKDL